MPQEPPGPSERIQLPGRDDFDDPTLDPRWISVRRPATDVASLEIRPGWMTLHGTPNDLGDPEPTFVGRRQQHHHCRARASVDVGADGRAGLAIRMDENSHCEVAVADDRIIASGRTGSFVLPVAEAPLPAGPVTLVIETGPHQWGPDTVRLGFEDETGLMLVLSEFDGRYLSAEVASGFVGRVIGMYAIECTAAFDWFDYEETA